ncbi:LINE-1 reverse transcriptase like, partial [Trifolium medium]|nr:LINE-1 reverse transcriptase like [Trifolium medium]
HCPIWLTATSNNWGPKPFRVINGWLEHPEFISFVEKSWKSFEVHGKKAYVLKEKFKLLKECLRKWNREVFGYLDLNIEKTVKDLNDIEGLLGGDVTELELTRREGLNKEFWSQLHLKESLLKQKSRKRERWEHRPNLNGIQFQSLSVEDNMLLMAPFSLEEVKEVIWCSDGNKCPGPDGFNFNFLKACWEIIKGDIMEFFSEFFSNATLPKAITSSFLALIPKKDHPQVLSDYRPIYVQQILDGVLVVNELLDLAKRRKDKGLFFKVDFERAYDTSSMSVLVNGSPTEDFSVGKGLRQGDPLSPFLFLIVAEGHTGLMSKAVDNSLFHGYKVSNNIRFHTLQFAADDTIIVGDGNWDNLWTIKTVLRSFEIVSGLKVNFYKSKIYGINLDDSFLSASSSFLNCVWILYLFAFLGFRSALIREEGPHGLLS